MYTVAGEALHGFMPAVSPYPEQEPLPVQLRYPLHHGKHPRQVSQTDIAKTHSPSPLKNFGRLGWTFTTVRSDSSNKCDKLKEPTYLLVLGLTVKGKKKMMQPD